MSHQRHHWHYDDNDLLRCKLCGAWRNEVAARGWPDSDYCTKVTELPGQADLFDPHKVARSDDPETSHEAARSLNKRKLSAQRENILRLLRGAGLTDEEIRDIYPQPRPSDASLRTRRNELVEMGLVMDSGRLRRTRSGRRAIVWKAV